MHAIHDLTVRRFVFAPICSCAELSYAESSRADLFAPKRRDTVEKAKSLATKMKIPENKIRFSQE
jgi:hypothetical protein